MWCAPWTDRWSSCEGSVPPSLDYQGAAAGLLHVWVALRANVRSVLESVTLADLAAGTLPAEVREMLSDDGAWESPDSPSF
ncbi:hypothetical protein GCM10025876_35970 [Demequina litorisediminis]|uniref:Uncharacterized protein n=1 Tax=Demequina litorisediminis TaxID=1849022 RepID=A0ABQ6IJT2_9MICO|nr:hypothetical protein GCM10025876_35970 [Demequina litorisediminis]